MRILAFSLVFFIGSGVFLVAQEYPQPIPPQPVGAPQDGGGPQQFGPGQGPGQQPGGGNAPPWARNANNQPGGGRGGPPGMGPPGQRGGQQQFPPRNQPGGARGGQQQPGGINPNQATQMIARLKAMDTNGNGILEPNEIPPNQLPRVGAMVQQLGGNPNGPINLAQLERQVMAMAGNAQPNQQQTNNTGRQPRQQTVVPLVRPFGEQVPTNSPVLEFGQKEAAPQTAQPGMGQQGRQQRDAAAAQMQQQMAAQAARNANAVRQSSTYDNIPATVRNNLAFSWFFEYDTDKDGQLTMLEYINGCGGIWTNKLVDEFQMLDRNGDGFVTVDEALATIAEWDKQREQEEKEQQAAAGSQGRPTPPAGTPANQGVRPANPNQGNPRQPAAGNQGGNGQGRWNQSGGRGGGGNNPGGGRRGASGQ